MKKWKRKNRNGCAYIFDADDTFVCVAQPQYADLIAANPIMYAALEFAYPAMVAACSSGKGSTQQMHKARIAVRRALSKAEGRKS